MIDELIEKYEALKKNEERLAFALESSGDGVWDYDVLAGTLFYSKAWKEILGYEKSLTNVENINNWKARIHEEDRDWVIRELEDHMAGRTPIYHVEYRLHLGSEDYIWILDRGKVVERDGAGRPLRVIGTDTDITKRKRMEAEIRNISLHDDLTGLPNRRFLNESLMRFNNEKYMPLTILIGDVNGLKLTNDIFGHSAGDAVLLKAAGVFKKACREGDMIARWGGDEFIIVLPKTSSEVADGISKRVKKECELLSQDDFGLSISIGYASKEHPEEDTIRIIKQAEDMMYTGKLLENRSYRSSLVNSMKKTLHEKSHETEEHASRLSNFCLAIAKRIQVPESHLDELELFSVLHDIGKIAIRDSILMKPGPLNDVEWVEMKRHSEIGYHIAKAAPELTRIAEYILCHHERWDGKGYPRGLKGADIPLFSRILAVVDTYDAMTCERPYRKPVPKEEALAEIKKNSGTQFDPEIVTHFLELFA